MPFVLIATCAIAMRLASPGSGALSYLLIAAYAATGSRQTLEAFLLSWFVTMINPAVAPLVPFGEFGRYLVILAAAASSALRFLSRREPLIVSRGELAIQVLGALLLVHSVLLSQMPAISTLKAVIWLLAVLSIVGAARSLAGEDRRVAERNIYGFLLALMIASIVLIPTAAGFFRNGTGFQGVLNHPQIFGPVAAILLARYLARDLGRAEFSARDAAIIALLVYFVFLSQTRTAMIAVVVAVTVSVLIVVAQGRNLRSGFSGILSARAALAVFLAPLVLLSSWDTLGATIGSFMAKTTMASEISLVEQYQTARGFLLDRALSNIRQHPWSGIGFGVPSVAGWHAPTRDPVFGIPISMPVEKGNVFVAIVEELGLVLGTSFLAWIGLRVLGAVGEGIAPLMTSIACLLINFGEAVLFSPGGQGLLILLLFLLSTQRRARS